MLESNKYRLKIIRFLKPFSFGVKKYMSLQLFLSLVTAGLAFVVPVIYRRFVDEVIVGGNFGAMKMVVLSYLAVFFAQTGLKYVMNYTRNKVLNRGEFRLKRKMLALFFTKDFMWYPSASIGDIKMKFDDDVLAFHDFSENQTIEYAKNLATAVVAAILMVGMEWRLALLSLTVIPITLFFDLKLAAIIAYTFKKRRENDRDMASWMKSAIEGWREVKSLNLHSHENRRFKKYIDVFAYYFGYYINFWVIRTLIIPKIKDEFLMQFSLYFLGGLMIMRGQLTIGALLVFIQYFNMLSEAVKTVSNLDAELLENKPKTDRVLEEFEQAQATPKGKKLIDPDGGIQFQNVTYSYPNTDSNVVANLSFHIQKGEKVAITGPSGAGKSTILKLIAGLITPGEGNVLLWGTDSKEVDLSQIHTKIGYVMQHNLLLNTTIRENLYYGKDGASDEALISACKKAQIYDFIKSLPQGFATYIGERGIKLSGGQKQRLVLARLFLRDVDVLIFDEATSALDQQGERFILDAIENLGQDKTVVMVAHRKSSIDLCDRIIEI